MGGLIEAPRRFSDDMMRLRRTSHPGQPMSGIFEGLGPMITGGADGDRTHDLHVANVALSQTELLPHQNPSDE